MLSSNAERTQPEQTGWLTTTEAASLLGVHPSTVRRWADEGSLPVMLTPGGHRRFAGSVIDRFASVAERNPSQLETVWAEHAIAHTRHQIQSRSVPGWIESLEPDERARGRALGRRLFGLILRYVSLPTGGEDLLEQVREIGRAYGATSMRAEIELRQALEAAMFFRDGVLETAFDLPQRLQLVPGENARLLRRLNPIMNAIQLAIVEAYEDARDEL
jgi:excisionase family DNA binding protein